LSATEQFTFVLYEEECLPPPSQQGECTIQDLAC